MSGRGSCGLWFGKFLLMVDVWWLVWSGCSVFGGCGYVCSVWSLVIFVGVFCG